MALAGTFSIRTSLALIMTCLTKRDYTRSVDDFMDLLLGIIGILFIVTLIKFHDYPITEDLL